MAKLLAEGTVRASTPSWRVIPSNSLLCQLKDVVLEKQFLRLMKSSFRCITRQPDGSVCALPVLYPAEDALPDIFESISDISLERSLVILVLKLTIDANSIAWLRYNIDGGEEDALASPSLCAMLIRMLHVITRNCYSTALCDVAVTRYATVCKAYCTAQCLFWRHLRQVRVVYRVAPKIMSNWRQFDRRSAIPLHRSISVNS